MSLCSVSVAHFKFKCVSRAILVPFNPKFSQFFLKRIRVSFALYLPRPKLSISLRSELFYPELSLSPFNESRLVVCALVCQCVFLSSLRFNPLLSDNRESLKLGFLKSKPVAFVFKIKKKVVSFNYGFLGALS